MLSFWIRNLFDYIKWQICMHFSELFFPWILKFIVKFWSSADLHIRLKFIWKITWKNAQTFMHWADSAILPLPFLKYWPAFASEIILIVKIIDLHIRNRSTTHQISLYKTHKIKRSLNASKYKHELMIWIFFQKHVIWNTFSIKKLWCSFLSDEHFQN